MFLYIVNLTHAVNEYGYSIHYILQILFPMYLCSRTAVSASYVQNFWMGN